MKVRLGGVTGHAKYFVMSDAKRKKLRLPASALCPVVTKARHLSGPMIEKADWERLREQQEPVWLFRPGGRALQHVAVKEYLRLASANGGCNRESGKIASRDPWYQTPLPANPHAFISGVNGRGVAFTFCEMDRLNATNTIYVVTFGADVPVGMRFAIAAHVLTEDFREAAAKARRRYAGGLLKFEPGDILRLSVPSNLPEESAESYSLAYQRWVGSQLS